MIIRTVFDGNGNNKEPRVMRAAAYCRVSTLMQDDSYEVQSRVYRDMIEGDPALEFAGIYADKGRSGTGTNGRPEFMRMIGDAKEHRFDVLYVKSVSRFARNVGDFQRYVDLLSDNGVTIVFEREGIRTDDRSGRLILALIGAVSQDESHSISQNVSLGYRERFARGKYNLGNNRILGYDSVNGRLVPNGDAWVVQMIFELYAAGETYHNIGRKLDDAGARTIRGNSFSPEAIRYIVSNETYIGDKRLQKKPPLNYLTHRPDPGIEAPGCYLTDDHPAIITRKLWEQAQARSSRGNRKP